MRRAPCPRGCFGQRAAEPGAVWRLAQSRVLAPCARQARKGRVGAMLEAKPPPSAAPGFPQPAPGFPHPSPPAFSSVLKHSAQPPRRLGWTAPAAKAEPGFSCSCCQSYQIVIFQSGRFILNELVLLANSRRSQGGWKVQTEPDSSLLTW